MLQLTHMWRAFGEDIEEKQCRVSRNKCRLSQLSCECQDSKDSVKEKLCCLLPCGTLPAEVPVEEGFHSRYVWEAHKKLM